MKRTTRIPKPEEIAEICSRKSTQSREDAINSIRVQNGLPKLKPTTQMTPAQLEHLKLIDAHLERLLAVAEKRTPGEWTHQVSSSDPHRSLVNLRHANGVVATFATRSGDLNLEFAASCAGNAEAGWKATRAAILALLEMSKFLDSVLASSPDTNSIEIVQSALLPHILNAFPLKLIQKP